jgi:nicotinate-nucleotide adenylyltransferase
MTTPRLAKPLPRRSFPRLPPVARGMRIGLLGGSFNPAHAAHRMISVMALKRLGLDQVWWLVTPGNPLKNNAGLPDPARRIREAVAVADHPRILLTDIETHIGTRYTYDTLAFLKAHHPDIRFVWLMGSDNLAGFHRWARWQEIIHLMPVAVFDRPGSSFSSLNSRAALAFAPYRIPERAAKSIAVKRTPAFVFIHGQRSMLSSTELRGRQKSVAN